MKRLRFSDNPYHNHEEHEAHEETIIFVRFGM